MDDILKSPIDTSFEFIPQNPFTIDIENEKQSGEIAHAGFPVEPEKAGILETAKEEFKETSSSYAALHYAEYNQREKPSDAAKYLYPQIEDSFIYKAPPPGWSPKSELQKLTDIDPKFMPKLLAAKNPQDFQYQLDDIYQQQHHDKVLENGSTFGKIIGGLVGLSPIGSIESMIPLATIATKAKVASGFLEGMMKSAPGMLAAGAIHEGAKQMDKVDGNIKDFMLDTFVDAAFGTVLFGGIGAGKTLVNMSEFNRLKEFSKKYLEGIGFEFVVNEKGDLKGFKAVPISNEAMSAAKVTKAQEMADAAFYKGGIFKIPFVGDTTLALISGNLSKIPGVEHVPVVRNIAKAFDYLLGSPLIRLKTSKYKAANAFADSAFDHFITTEGEARGGTRAVSFEAKVKQTRAMLTDLKVQTVALHAEANGYTIKARPAIGIQNAWSAMKQKSIQAISQDTKSTDYMSEVDFMDRAQRVMATGTPDELAPVNELASLYRNVYTNTMKAYLEAHNLPPDYYRNMDTYLSRVYNIPHLNENEVGQNGWVPVLSSYYKKADELITQRMQPIHDLESQIKDFKSAHNKAFEELGKRELQLHPSRPIPYPDEYGVNIRNYLDEIPKGSKINRGNANRETPLLPYQDIFETYSNMREKLRGMKDKLQNELRSNPEMDYHIEDRNALSADEAKELKDILQPLKDIKQQIEDQEYVVSSLKKKKSNKLETAQKQETVENAKPHAAEHAAQQEQLQAEEDKLHELKIKHEDKEYDLYDKARSGKINPRLYNPLNFKFKDPANRLKFRKVFGSDREREQLAKAQYYSIMQMHPEDIVADMFGKITGNEAGNPLKERTVLVPEDLLYNNNFMTKDLYSKTANYVNFLSRRTHLKTSFQDVTINGDFNELAVHLLNEHKENRERINNRIAKLKDPKQIEVEKKALKKEKIDFEAIKKDMQYLFENRMMGLNKRHDFDDMARRTWMSLTAAANLHNLPATQITDLAFGGFQHGIWPFVRDGVYPIISSMAGMLKTKDSEALREMAPHINLGYQDMLNNYADRNWSSELQPYYNMGKWVKGVEKFAHFSAVTDLSLYIDNGIQHSHGSVIQSRFMELLHKQVAGTLTNKESLYLRKYGIDPKEWGERMVKAYQDSNGFQTKLGGYVSKAWLWQDMEAANKFNDSVFRGVQNTLVWKGMADSPFFADNILGLFFHTFTGWGYASVNRYLIPSLQHADGELLVKMLWMAGAGALVSPTRRISRGDEPWPEDMTPSQHAYEAFSDSGIFSTVGNVLNIANFLSSDKLLGDLKNDKFRNRARTGIFGMSDVVSSTANRISDVLGMAQSGIDEKDLKTAAHMLPITGAMYGHYISDKLIESWDLPRNKRAAEAQ